MVLTQLLLYLPQIVGVVFIAVLILFNREPNKDSRLLALPMLLIAAWLGSQLVAQILGDSDLTLTFVRITASFSCILAVAYNLSIKRYLNIKKGVLSDVLLIIVGFGTAIACLTDTIIYRATADMNGISIDDASPMYFAILIFMLAVYAAALIRLFKTTRRLPREQRSGNYVLFYSTLQMVVLSGFGTVFLAHVAAAQVLIFVSAFIFAVGVMFGIVRHRLFDVRLIIVRTIGYILSLTTLALIYVASAFIVSRLFFNDHISTSVSFSPVNIILALVLAFIFQPIKNFFDKITNRIFYREQYDTEEFFALLSNVLSSNSNLNGLLEQASDVIAATLKSKQAFFFVRYGEAQQIVAGTKNHQKFLSQEVELLDVAVNKTRKLILETDDLVASRTVYATLRSHEVDLLLPLRHDGKIMGYLALGENLSSGYSRRDKRVLETLADELVIAIQNSLSLEAVRQVNANLQERIDGATRDLRSKNERLKELDDIKDEFMSMASHQLRTPLTSVKGYLSMILDGDAGEITPQQRRFLSEAFESSTRMAGLIGDFLNVSRLQTGKFTLEREELNLAELVASEVSHLEHTAEARGLKLQYHQPEHFPLMNLDKSKIQQVVMNFIDNAIFYAPNTGSVDIELFQRSGRAVFTVRDHGIGVPKSEQPNLFGKFFRATNARKKRPDGTGVGLFLAKKVIVAHKGAIVFDSEEGKGSTFGFEIPMAQHAYLAEE